MAHRLLIKLYDDIKNTNINIEKKFRLDDYEKNGLVPFYSFQANIKKINKGISEEDFLRLDNKYKVDHPDEPKYNYKKLLEDIKNIGVYESSLSRLWDDIVKQMKLGRPNLFDEIEKFDAKLRGEIEISDLQSCFNRLDININNHNYVESIKFCFSSEETGRIEYRYLRKEFMMHLDNLDIDFDELCENKADVEEIDEYWSKNIYLEFYRHFTKESILSPMAFFREGYMAPGKDFITSYKFQKAITDVYPDIRDDDLNRFQLELTDKGTGRISLEKFCKVYDEMRLNFDLKEISALEVGGDDSQLEKTRILYKIMMSIEGKGKSMMEFFSNYEFQSRMKTITKASFYEACGDLDIEEENLSFEEIEEIFKSEKASVLNLSPLKKFIQEYKDQVPFYLDHKYFNRQKELLQSLIDYSYELRKAEKVVKMLLQEDKDRTGVMDFNDFLFNLSLMELGITMESDQLLLLDKYDTFKDETVNILEFSLDFENLLLDHYPQAGNHLKASKPNMEKLVEMLGERILDSHETFEKWISTFRKKKLGWRLPIPDFMLKLREEDPELSLKEIHTIISELDKQKRGYIINFRVKDYFANYSQERASSGLLKLIEIIKLKKINLPEYTKSCQTKPGIINFKQFARQVKQEEIKDEDGYPVNIEKHEVKEMLDSLNIGGENIELSELQLKIKHECKVHDILSLKETEEFILGKVEQSENLAKVSKTLNTILEPLIASLRTRNLEFEDHFGKKPIMKKHIFKQRMKTLGLLKNPRYSDLLDYIESKDLVSDVDLTKLRGLLEEQENVIDEGYVAGKDPAELIQHIKNIFQENRIKVSRIFNRYDSDNSDFISAREFFVLIKEIEPEITKRDIKAMYKEIDRNGDKQISKLEFEKIFSVSLKDQMTSKIKKMSWASSYFAEMSYVMKVQARTLRDYFKKGARKGKIGVSAFRIFIDDLDLQSLGTGRSKRKKLEEALKVEGDLKEDIDFYLLKACLEEYQDFGQELAVHEDRNTQLMGLICQRFDYDLGKICHVFDFDDDGEVTKYEFLTICENIIPKRKESKLDKDGNLETDQLSKQDIKNTFAFICLDNADAKSVPDAAFKAAFDQFQKELKYITVKKLNYFIFENWTKIDKECKEREMNDGSKDDDSQDGQKSSSRNKGYVSKTSFSRVLDSLGYDMEDKELKALEHAYPEYIKTDRVYYSQLLKDIRKRIKKTTSNKNRKREKDFEGILELIKRKLDYDPGNLSDEFLTLDTDEDGFVYLEDCLEILDEISEGKISRKIEDQICDKLLCLKEQLIDYKKVVSFVFTGKTSIDRIYETMNHSIVTEFAEQIREEMKLRQIPSHELFKYFDSNGDKKITQDEFMEESGRIFMGYSERELKSIFSEIEENFAENRKKKVDIQAFRNLIFGYRAKDIRPLINRVRAELDYRGKSLSKFFYEADKKRDRKLTFNEFYQSLKKIDFQMTPIEADILFSFFDVDRNFSLSLSEFTEKLETKSSMNEYSQLLYLYLKKNRYDIPYLISQFTSSKEKSKITLVQFMKMSREVCSDALKEKEIKQVFEEIDQNRDKFITVEEFEYLFDRDVTDAYNVNFGRLKIEIMEELTESKQSFKDYFNAFASVQSSRKHKNQGLSWDLSDFRRCLIGYNIELRKSEESALYDFLDQDRDGYISFGEFKRAVLGKKVNTKNLITAVRRVVKKDKIDARKLAINIDIDGNKKIEFKEFSEFLEELKLNFSYKDSLYLFEKLDSDKSGTIDYDEIMNIFDTNPKKKNSHPNIMVTLLEDLRKTDSWEEAYSNLDTSDRGLTATKFVRFLQDINSRLDKFEGYEAFNKLDYKGKGVISLYELEDFIDDAEKQKTGISHKTGEQSNLYKQNQENLEELRDSFNDMGKDGYAVFKQIDYNNDGLMPKRHFESVLKSNGVLIGRSKTVRQLLGFYQRPHSVLIDYKKMFEDVKVLKPKIPNFALFLANDVVSVCKKRKKDLKELFVAEEADVGDFDGKLSLGEFGKFVSRHWGEGGKVKIEVQGKVRGKRDKARMIKRGDDEPSRKEISQLFKFLKGEEEGTRKGNEERKTQDITFVEFLKLFDRDARKEHVYKIFDEFNHIVNNMKIALLQTATNIMDFLKGNDEKRNFILKVQNMTYVKENSLLSEIKKFAEKLEQPSRKGFISLPLIGLLLEDTEVVGDVPVNSNEVKRGKMPQKSIMKKREEERVLVGEEEFSKEDIKKIKKLMKSVNNFIEEDEMEFNEPFEDIDKEKTGFLNPADFEDVIYEDIGVDEETPGIKEAMDLAIRFGREDDKINYRKFKDLIEGKFDNEEKKVEFELKEDKEKDTESPTKIDKTRIKELQDSIKVYYKKKKLHGDKLFKKFSADNKTVKEDKLIKTLVKDIKEIKEEDAKLLFESMLPKNSKTLEKQKFLKIIDSKPPLDITPVKFEGDFEDQVESVFKLIDINQNDLINKQELKLGCRKLGLNPNDEEIENLFNSFKEHNGSNALTKVEFKNLISYKYRNDLVKPAMMLESLKDEIEMLDVYKTGYLNREQIRNLYERMGLQISEAELDGYIKEIGDEETQRVEEDLFVRFVISNKQKFGNPQVGRAVVKLRGAYSPGLADLINSFNNMPENYFRCFTEDLFLKGENWPACQLEPKLAKSNVYYTNVFPPVKNGSSRLRRNKKNKFIRNTKDNLMVMLTLKRAIGIPIPSPEILKHSIITNRSLRILFFDKSKNQFLGNVLEIPCRYNPDYEDRWYFDNLHKIKTGTSANENYSIKIFGGKKNSNQILIKKGDFTATSDINIELVFEFVVWIKRKESKFDIAMSNGYAKVKLIDLQKQSKFKLKVVGGNPANNDLQINPQDIRKGRKGFVATFLSLFEGKVSPALEFSCTSKLGKHIYEDCLSLPNLISASLLEVPVLSLFRQCLGYVAFRYPNLTDFGLEKAHFVINFIRLFNISTAKYEFCEFFNENVKDKIESMPFERREKVMGLMMQKVYQMLDHSDFHFSKSFPTRDYHSDKIVQVKRVKLMKKCFNETIKLFLRQVKIFEKKSLGVVKTHNMKPKYTGTLKGMTNLSIPANLKNVKKLAVAPKREKAFNVMDLYNDEEENDGFGNCDFD